MTRARPAHLKQEGERRRFYRCVGYQHVLEPRRWCTTQNETCPSTCPMVVIEVLAKGVMPEVINNFTPSDHAWHGYTSDAPHERSGCRAWVKRCCAWAKHAHGPARAEAQPKVLECRSNAPEVRYRNVPLQRGYLVANARSPHGGALCCESQCLRRAPPVVISSHRPCSTAAATSGLSGWSRPTRGAKSWWRKCQERRSSPPQRRSLAPASALQRNWPPLLTARLHFKVRALRRLFC